LYRMKNIVKKRLIIRNNKKIFELNVFL